MRLENKFWRQLVSSFIPSKAPSIAILGLNCEVLDIKFEPTSVSEGDGIVGFSICILGLSQKEERT